MRKIFKDTDKSLGVVITAIIIFLVLTVLAMFLYVGGNEIDPSAPHYSFSRNFFSTLGLTVAYGQPNTASAILFFIALMSVGLGLILFFLVYPRYFTGQLSCRIWSLLGSAFGIISGVCFVGVAFTPADLFYDAHVDFVLWAFRLIPIAIVFYTFAILQHRLYPSRNAIGFAVFAALLIAYVWLLTEGPSSKTPDGLLIQAVGQKVIAYTSLLSIFIQARSARKLLRTGFFKPVSLTDHVR